MSLWSLKVWVHESKEWIVDWVVLEVKVEVLDETSTLGIGKVLVQVWECETTGVLVSIS